MNTSFFSLFPSSSSPTLFLLATVIERTLPPRGFVKRKASFKQLVSNIKQKAAEADGGSQERARAREARPPPPPVDSGVAEATVTDEDVEAAVAELARDVAADDGLPEAKRWKETS